MLRCRERHQQRQLPLLAPKTPKVKEKKIRDGTDAQLPRYPHEPRLPSIRAITTTLLGTSRDRSPIGTFTAPEIPRSLMGLAERAASGQNDRVFAKTPLDVPSGICGSVLYTNSPEEEDV